jgi:hypothetical protein
MLLQRSVINKLAGGILLFEVVKRSAVPLGLGLRELARDRHLWLAASALGEVGLSVSLSPTLGRLEPAEPLDCPWLPQISGSPKVQAWRTKFIKQAATPHPRSATHDTSSSTTPSKTIYDATDITN